MSRGRRQQSGGAGGGAGGHGEGHEGGDERWLLTYADMITLLMALFIVMWSISSVNTSKFAELSVSLKQAFNGKLVEGGDEHRGRRREPHAAAAEHRRRRPGQADRDRPHLGRAAVAELRPDHRRPAAKAIGQSSSRRGRRPREPAPTSSTRLDKWTASHGLKKKVETTIDERGLVVRVLTDKLLFDSGKAVLKPTAQPLLASVAGVHPHDAARDERRPRRGQHRQHPDLERRVPLELGAVRRPRDRRARDPAAATASPPGACPRPATRDQRPLATNRSATGRSPNRRVELVVLRRADSGLEGATP